jgi:large subunit ribosomal protein L21
MYAVIKTGGKQHRVSEGDVLKIEKLAGQKGDTVVFEEVLLVSKEDLTRVGQPVVASLSRPLSPWRAGIGVKAR